MTANQIRQKFFDFFESKGHAIVSSAPIVLKDDPTLMFTNAGMNQFKDLFLGYKKPTVRRIADTQKCLRVSGKHNDLEEVGRDSYHHTMFEMLGNWSIGDYFKEEAIDYAWELLTKAYGLDPSRIYASVFGGDAEEGLEVDNEAATFWKKYLPEERILHFSKKDNFWEMGDTGPCGPCSELHFDMRSDEERNNIPGKDLVNNDSPMVVEIWNLVFIQFNRKADGSLETLPEKHVDTGMGFERLCMAMQGKTSNYDTDIFSPFIHMISEISGIAYTGKYDNSSMSDIAMRVAADHLRAVSFAIADGELPSNTGAGYVIRRILRRSVRYNYSFLGQEQPMLHKLVPLLAERFKDVFPELIAQKSFVEKVILEEEKSFLKTLNGGLKRLENITVVDNIIGGQAAFELYDTYGFPIDLTRLIAAEKGQEVDDKGFDEALAAQKLRSRSDAKKVTGDWVKLSDSNDVDFVGYDTLQVEDAGLLSYRMVQQKDQTLYQMVLDKTPFYAEGGGQVGDQGTLTFDGEVIKVIDTKKENDLIVHYTDRLPEKIEGLVEASVDVSKRRLTENNHSATHLLHAALREVLGEHVQQKGSLVKDEYLRFDFAHFQKMSADEILKVERRVNEKIRENISLQEDRSLPIAAAKDAGAMMLFGEKYGEKVRMITFDPKYSRELCGGCHVQSTGVIGLCKIISEGAIAAGVRRIEAVTSTYAEDYLQSKISELEAVKDLFKSPLPAQRLVSELQDENKRLQKEIEKYQTNAALSIKDSLIEKAATINGIKVLKASLKGIDGKNAKTLGYNILQEIGEAVIVFGLDVEDKAQVLVIISEELTKSRGLHAGNMVKTIAPYINGGGGGQAFFATAGGTNISGIAAALKAVDDLLMM